MQSEDLGRAFYGVNHDIFLFTSKVYAVTGKTFSLIIPYLEDRHHRVTSNDSTY